MPPDAGNGLEGIGMKEVPLRAPSSATGRPKQADLLIEIASEADLYYSPDGTAYADVRISGHRETHRVRSSGFRRWLARAYYGRYRSAPRGEAMLAALGIIEARARYDGSEREVYLRVAGADGLLYVDLADAQWRAVEIDAGGWRIVNEPPVRFRRAPGMLPLPEPQRGGSIDELRALVNVRAADWPLVVGWPLAALAGRAPYPVLSLDGEQGSAKSTIAAMLRGLVDPNSAPLRSPPRDERDLVIAASNGHVIALDNVSHLPDWLSDGLCRIATGGGYATRTLYSDQDETIFAGRRPIILTGIGGHVTRGDLADRAIIATLDPIPEERRRPEAELSRAYDAARPRILGALLDAVAYGLRELPNTRLDRLPRMADFALWVSACEGALWPPGRFLAAYDRARSEADESVIEGDPVAVAIRDLLAERDEWSGTASDLLAAIAERAGERAARSKDWPSSPRALSSRLTRLAPALRRTGIAYRPPDPRRRRGRGSPRILTLARREAEKAGDGPSPPSPSPPSPGFRGGEGEDRETVETIWPATVSQTVSRNPLNNNDKDGGDGGDAKFATFSARDDVVTNRNPLRWRERI